MQVDDFCINYARKEYQDNAAFRLAFPTLESILNVSDFGFENCSMLDFGEDGDVSNVLLVTITDTAKPAYITYQGFIIAVFNYSV